MVFDKSLQCNLTHIALLSSSRLPCVASYHLWILHMRSLYAIILSLSVTPLIAQETPATILSQTKASRHALPKSYHLELIRHYILEQGEELGKISVWLKGDKCRTDTYKKSSTLDTTGSGWRLITCRNCERLSYAISTRVGVETSRSQVSFIKIDEKYDSQDQYRIDWRTLGLLNDCLYQYSQQPYAVSLDSFLKYSDGTVQIKKHNGFTCYVLTIAVQGVAPTVQTLWLRPDLGMQPVLFHADIPSVGLIQSTSIDYKAVDRMVSCYPASIHHLRSLNGVNTLNETITTQFVEFGGVISDDVFTLSGLDLDDHQPVNFPEITRREQAPIWRNGRIDPIDTSESLHRQAVALTNSPNEPLRKPTKMWLYFAVAIVFAFFGLLLAYIAWKLRASVQRTSLTVTPASGGVVEVP